MGETFSNERANNRQSKAIRVSHLVIPCSPWLQLVIFSSKKCILIFSEMFEVM